MSARQGPGGAGACNRSNLGRVCSTGACTAPMLPRALESSLMKLIRSAVTLTAALVTLAATALTQAADAQAPAATNDHRAVLREKLKNMTPAERQAARQAARERQQKAAAEARKLTPEERQAVREKRRKALEDRKDLAPEQRAVVVKERRAKLEQRRDELQQKQRAGSLSKQESRQLDQLERRLK